MKYNSKIQNQLKGLWEVGDACFHNYELKIIKSVRPDGMVDEISSGYITGGGLDNRPAMFPVTLFTILITDSVSRNYKRLQNSNLERSLNWPDLHRQYCDFHIRGCELALKHEPLWDKYTQAQKEKVDTFFKNFYVEVDDFTNEVLSLCDKNAKLKVGKVGIFR